MKHKVREGYKVYVKINKIQNNGCFCSIIGLIYEGYGFMPKSLMMDYYKNGICDLKIGATITAYIHEIKTDDFIIFSDEFAFQTKIKKEKSMPIDILNIKNLVVGIVIGIQKIDIISSIEKYIVILCFNGSVRFIDSQKRCVNISKTGFHENDIVLVEVSLSDEVDFAIPLSDLNYYDNANGYQCNVVLNEKAHCRIPNKFINESDFFIFKSGETIQGRCIFDGYCRYRMNIYLLNNLTEDESYLIHNYFNNDNRKEPQDIIEDVELYLNDNNITEVLESFTIQNEEFCHSRPGKDDYYYIHKTSKQFEDEYINSLFPHIYKTIYEDHGYCPANSMRIDFEEHPYRNEELEFIKIAKENYNKDEHRVFLLKKYFTDYEKKQKAAFIHKLNLRMSLFKTIKSLLLSYDIGMEYGRDLNNLLITYYNAYKKEIDNR